MKSWTKYISQITQGLKYFTLLISTIYNFSIAEETIEKDQTTIMQDFSIQLDGQYASDTFFEELPGSDPQLKLFVGQSITNEEE